MYGIVSYQRCDCSFENNMQDDVGDCEDNQSYRVDELCHRRSVSSLDERDDGVPDADEAENAHRTEDVLVLKQQSRMLNYRIVRHTY